MNWINPFGTGYNVPNTIILSVVAVIGAWLVWKLVEKLKVKIDNKLATAVIGWVFLTAGFRVLQDAGVVHSRLLTSPWLYLISSVVTVSVLSVLYKISKRNYWKYSAFISFAGFFVTLIFLPLIKNLMFPSYFLIFFLPWVFLLYSFFQVDKLSKENLLVLLSQLYDANITAVSIQYFGYVSKHVLPTAIILFGSPFAFIFVKFFVTLGILLFLDWKVKQKNLRNYVKLLIALFGLLTGSRDLLRGLIGI